MGTGNSGFFCVPGGIYAYEHNYNTEKGYTIPKNTTIGKCTDDDLNNPGSVSLLSGLRKP